MYKEEVCRVHSSYREDMVVQGYEMKFSRCIYALNWSGH